MFVLRAGCKVPFPEKLSEEYMLIENQIIANISADKIKDIMNHFIYIHEEPVFFILELPSKQDDEEEIRPGIVEKCIRMFIILTNVQVKKHLRFFFVSAI